MATGIATVHLTTAFLLRGTTVRRFVVTFHGNIAGIVARAVPFRLPRPQQGCGDREAEERHDDEEGDLGGDVHPFLRAHLSPHEDQHQPQPHLQVPEGVHDRLEHEIEGPQSKDGEDVRGKDDNGSRVTAKIAGIESTAKTTSVASTTSSTGRSAVAYHLPRCFTRNFPSPKWRTIGNTFPNSLRTGLCSGWVSTSFPERIFPPV